jgi:hypothetical protein
MATTTQRQSAGHVPVMFLAGELTFGQSATSRQLVTQIERAYDHVMVLDHATFDLGSAYLPFMPKRSFQVKPRYRFVGRMPSLAYHLDD